MKTYVNAEG